MQCLLMETLPIIYLCIYLFQMDFVKDKWYVVLNWEIMDTNINLSWKLLNSRWLIMWFKGNYRTILNLRKINLWVINSVWINSFTLVTNFKWYFKDVSRLWPWNFLTQVSNNKIGSDNLKKYTTILLLLNQTISPFLCPIYFEIKSLEI